MTASPLALTLVGLAVVLLAGRLGAVAQTFGLHATLGELLAGLILGALVAAVPPLDGIRHNPAIAFVGELGVIVLLFQIGLESDLTALRAVGPRALAVALVGVLMPFALGCWVIAPWLLPEAGMVADYFVGASLTATSVAISARVLQERGLLELEAARVILGAAVIDDVLGLLILAMVSGLARDGSFDARHLLWISAAALGFLTGSLLFGALVLRPAVAWLTRMGAGPPTRLCVALAAGLMLAGMAEAIGLAAIVGAFAAGLVLDQAAADRNRSTDGAPPQPTLDALLRPLGYFAVPVFFVGTGMAVDFRVLAHPAVLMATAGLAAAAVLGKLACGLPGPAGQRWIVAWGMVPRGEVGLIFAASGQALGVIPPSVFAAILGMVIVTTLVAPVALDRVCPPAGKEPSAAP